MNRRLAGVACASPRRGGRLTTNGPTHAAATSYWDCRTEGQNVTLQAERCDKTACTCLSEKTTAPHRGAVVSKPALPSRRPRDLARGTSGVPLALNGPSTTRPERSEGFRALAHAPISSALSQNRSRSRPSSNRTCSAISDATAARRYTDRAAVVSAPPPSRRPTLFLSPCFAKRHELSS